MPYFKGYQARHLACAWRQNLTRSLYGGRCCPARGQRGDVFRAKGENFATQVSRFSSKNLLRKLRGGNLARNPVHPVSLFLSRFCTSFAHSQPNRVPADSWIRARVRGGAFLAEDVDQLMPDLPVRKTSRLGAVALLVLAIGGACGLPNDQAVDSEQNNAAIGVAAWSLRTVAVGGLVLVEGALAPAVVSTAALCLTYEAVKQERDVQLNGDTYERNAKLFLFPVLDQVVSAYLAVGAATPAVPRSLEAQQAAANLTLDVMNVVVEHGKETGTLYEAGRLLTNNPVFESRILYEAVQRASTGQSKPSDVAAVSHFNTLAKFLSLRTQKHLHERLNARSPVGLPIPPAALFVGAYRDAVADLVTAQPTLENMLKDHGIDGTELHKVSPDMYLVFLLSGAEDPTATLANRTARYEAIVGDASVLRIHDSPDTFNRSAEYRRVLSLDSRCQNYGEDAIGVAADGSDQACKPEENGMMCAGNMLSPHVANSIQGQRPEQDVRSTGRCQCNLKPPSDGEMGPTNGFFWECESFDVDVFFKIEAVEKARQEAYQRSYEQQMAQSELRQQAAREQEARKFIDQAFDIALDVFVTVKFMSDLWEVTRSQLPRPASAAYFAAIRLQSDVGRCEAYAKKHGVSLSCNACADYFRGYLCDDSDTPESPDKCPGFEPKHPVVEGGSCLRFSQTRVGSENGEYVPRTDVVNLQCLGGKPGDILMSLLRKCTCEPAPDNATGSDKETGEVWVCGDEKTYPSP